MGSYKEDAPDTTVKRARIRFRFGELKRLSVSKIIRKLDARQIPLLFA
jgi:hypothetical protein